MKSIKYSISFVLIIFQILCLSAQNFDPDFEPCGTKTIHESHYSTDEIYHHNYRSPNGDTFTYVIPIVFHIFHDYGPENISNAIIYTVLQEINDNFNRENQDTLNIPEPFRMIRGKLNLQFKLARIDPNGNCTDGIIRHNFDFTSNVGWDKNKYLNIYVRKHINNFTTSGLYYRYLDLTFETTSVTYPTFFEGFNTLTHEIGHYLNLEHVFSNDNSCSNADFVEDTPIQNKPNFNCVEYPHYSCPEQANGDNFNNFMDYSKNCRNMFTRGQEARMRNNLHGKRSEIFSDSNIIKSGVLLTTSLNCGFKPTASYGAGYHFTNCINHPIQFNDASNFEPKYWNWSFENGIPNNSSEKDPLVVYNKSGLFNVKLIVSNSFGSDTIERKIKISEGFNRISNAESFDSENDAKGRIVLVTPNDFYENGNYPVSDTYNKGNYHLDYPLNNRIYVIGHFKLEKGKKYRVKYKLAYGKDEVSNTNGRNNVRFLRIDFKNNDCNIKNIIDYFPNVPRIRIDTSFVGFSVDKEGKVSEIEWHEMTQEINPEIFGDRITMHIYYSDSTTQVAGFIGPLIDDVLVEEIESTSTNEFESEKEFWNIYPNPTNSIFKSDKAKYKKYATVSIHDINGTLIKSYFQSDSVLDIDISNLKAGIYLIKYQSEYFTSTKKLIKL